MSQWSTLINIVTDSHQHIIESERQKFPFCKLTVTNLILIVKIYN